jgi:hypothetical protein
MRLSLLLAAVADKSQAYTASRGTRQTQTIKSLAPEIGRPYAPPRSSIRTRHSQQRGTRVPHPVRSIRGGRKDARHHPPTRAASSAGTAIQDPGLSRGERPPRQVKRTATFTCATQGPSPPRKILAKFLRAGRVRTRPRSLGARARGGQRRQRPTGSESAMHQQIQTGQGRDRIN